MSYINDLWSVDASWRVMQLQQIVHVVSQIWTLTQTLTGVSHAEKRRSNWPNYPLKLHYSPRRFHWPKIIDVWHVVSQIWTLTQTTLTWVLRTDGRMDGRTGGRSAISPPQLCLATGSFGRSCMVTPYMSYCPLNIKIDDFFCYWPISWKLY
jgi:hypothetical protein